MSPASSPSPSRLRALSAEAARRRGRSNSGGKRQRVKAGAPLKQGALLGDASAFCASLAAHLTKTARAVERIAREGENGKISALRGIISSMRHWEPVLPLDYHPHTHRQGFQQRH